MRLRLLIAGIPLTLFACGTSPSQPATSIAPSDLPAQRESIERAPSAPAAALDIPARDQAPQRPPSGWCAETAIQEAMLFFGAYAPQQDINRAGQPRNPDLYWDDVPVALSELGLTAVRWSGDGGQADFTRWVSDGLAAGHPVIAGVKIYPTEQPRWGLDHIVLIVGVEDDGAMLINTTWGYRLRRSTEQLAATDKGISLANRYDRQFAYAIEGFSQPESGPALRLEIARETASQIQASVRIENLIEGRRYGLRRRDGEGDVTVASSFDARATSGRVSVTLDPAESTRFEAVAIADAER
jgi:hypothetical protein